ncbi:MULTISPECIES: TIGR02300 family protein [Lichenihabitans]|uniref:TIGR02300 family protein n=1 Tax=Lichenihabitans TaxID=2723776 RepID=UPI001036417D|nr:MULTISPECIES: TIGR02300 family protein [Lichenihabitans]UDL94267.1 TIGR02300 family protein [Lichenihabitans sp. PAMC28606]
MAKPELGAKRQCQNCSTKFFDLNKDPIVCPNCGTVFQALPVARVARAAPAARDEGDVEAEAAGAEIVSLEDVEAGEKVEAAAEDDIEVDDVPADDTFLEEEEEENDDVADLIDGDIEDDEEA